MAAPTIMLGDDEELMRRVLRSFLASRGYVTREAGTGQEIVNTVSQAQPDLILLDLGLPDMDGIEVIYRLRQIAKTPIIILSVRAAQSDKIAALEAGADDYVTKPFQPLELLEHVRAATLINTLQDGSILVAGDLRLDLERHVVELGKKHIQLTLIECDVLRGLIVNAGRLLTQHRLTREAWGTRSIEKPLHLLRSTIGSLRVKLETDPARPRYIATEPGVGYRLRVEP